MDHRKSAWLAAIGLNRCAACGDPAPCPGELRQRVEIRDVDRERATIEWQRQMIVAQDRSRRIALGGTP